MEIQPVHGLDHAVSGQEYGTGPGNRAANKDLGSGEMIAVTRSEYERLRNEAAAFRSESFRRSARAKRLRKAIATGAMYVGSVIVAPAALATGGYIVEDNLLQSHIAETREKFPEFEYATMRANTEQHQYFQDRYNSMMLIHLPAGLGLVSGLYVAAAGILTIPSMGIARLIDLFRKKRN